VVDLILKKGEKGRRRVRRSGDESGGREERK
jgi:hypothetical protein